MNTMKTCNCRGNDSLRSAIGGIRCECGGLLNLAQTLQRIISRLNECDEQDSELIQGLVALDAGQCGYCQNWFKESELIRAGDRACCERCWHWDFFIREEDDEETVDHVLPELMSKIIHGKQNNYHRKPYLALLPKDKATGQLAEPFLTEYRKYNT